MPLDRTGELLDADQAAAQPHQRATSRPPCSCTGGWIDRDADQPVPCPMCRPYLVRRHPDAEQAPPDLDSARRGIAFVRAALTHRRPAPTTEGNPK